MTAPTSSSGWPNRRSGMRFASSTTRGWEKNGAFPSVRKNPGAIALAAIPFWPSSTARAHEGLEPALRGHVGRIALKRPRPHHRGDEDEPPLAAGRHVPRGRARELVLRHQVGLHQAAEVVGRDVLQGPAVADRRIVDEAIEAAATGHDRGHRLRPRARIGDVEGGGEGVRNTVRDLAGPRRVAPVDPDRGAGRRHAARDGEPEPSGRAGDQHDAPRQREALDPRRLVHVSPG